MSATLDERNAGGYSVAYVREDIYFPVYISAALAAVFCTAAWITGAIYWLLPAVAAASFTYYNIPLLETGRPTRAMTVHELQIVLNAPLRSALVVDWRKQPIYRLLMRLPWRMDHNGAVRINLEPFDQPPDVIHRTFLRMWRFYRS